MTICRYFLQGNCRFGDRCRFEHTDPHDSYSYDNSNRRNDYAYQDRSRQSNYSQDWNKKHDQNPSYGSQRYNSYEGYNQNQRSYSNDGRQQSPERYDRFGVPVGYSSTPRHSESRHDGFQSGGTYYENKYGQSRHKWVSDDYKNKMEQKGHGGSSIKPFVNASTPKSNISFSFKDPDQNLRREHPIDLHMNEANMLFAEIIKEDATAWELGKQWPFSCYCPMQDKSGFPGFKDLSPEELRLEAYVAKENNTYNSYIQSVEKELSEIKYKRNQLKEPSIQLMSIIERIRAGEDLISEDTIDGGTSPLKFNKGEFEDMAADESFLSTDTKTAASAFSFKTALDTDSISLNNSAASFSFKMPFQSKPKQTSDDGDPEIYTPLDKLSVQDKEQFSASTFTLGKIPTVPPSKILCS